MDSLILDFWEKALDPSFKSCHWGLCSSRAAQPQWLWASLAMETPDGQSGGLSTLLWIVTVLQSQGDSRWVRIPLKSNLSKAVKEGQHRWSHSGPAWKKKVQIHLQHHGKTNNVQTVAVMVVVVARSILLHRVMGRSLFISVINRVKQAGQASCVSSDYFSNLHLRAQCDSMGYSSPLMLKSNLHSHRGCFMHSRSVIKLLRCTY